MKPAHKKGAQTFNPWIFFLIIPLPLTWSRECNAVTTLYLNRESAVGVEHFSLYFRKHLLQPLFHQLRESTGPRIITSTHKLQHWNKIWPYGTVELFFCNTDDISCSVLLNYCSIFEHTLKFWLTINIVICSRFLWFSHFSNLCSFSWNWKSRDDLWLIVLPSPWLNTRWPVFSWKVVVGVGLHGATGTGRAVTMGRYCRRSAISLSRP